MTIPKLILVDPEARLCTAWRECFEDLPNIEVVNEQISWPYAAFRQDAVGYGGDPDR